MTAERTETAQDICTADWGSAAPSQRCTRVAGHAGQHRDAKGKTFGAEENPPPFSRDLSGDLLASTLVGPPAPPPVTYDVTTPDGTVHAAVTGERLNELLDAHGDLPVRVHAEDHTRRPRRPGDPHTDARPVTGARLFAGLNHSELECLYSRLQSSQDDLSYLRHGDSYTRERPPLPEIDADDARVLWNEIFAISGLALEARKAVLAGVRRRRLAVA